MIGFEVCDRGEAEYEGSRMFGDPVVPEGWADSEPWTEDEIFMCQINLDDLKGYDTDGLLPEKGYLYFFADMTDGIVIRPILSEDEPDTIYEDCNMGFDEVEGDIFTDWVIRFGKGRSSVLGRDGGDVILLDLDLRGTGVRFLEDIGGRVRVVIPEGSLRRKDLSGAVTVIPE
ncbi:MAG: DUF1963 domain-containing protein [Candidatus Methanomethylophilaceae archaeon]